MYSWDKKIWLIRKKLTSNIVINVKWLNIFPLRSEARQGCKLSPLPFNFVLPLPRTIRQENEIKDIQTGKKEVKLYFLANNVILCIETHKESIKQSTRINKLLISAKFQGTRSIYKINIQNLFCFYILAKKNWNI